MRDIRPRWLNVIRRMQSAGRKLTTGYHVVTINVLVDCNSDPVLVNGEPMVWTKPNVLSLEPGTEDVASILDKMVS